MEFLRKEAMCREIERECRHQRIKTKQCLEDAQGAKMSAERVKMNAKSVKMEAGSVKIMEETSMTTMLRTAAQVWECKGLRTKGFPRSGD